MKRLALLCLMTCATACGKGDGPLQVFFGDPSSMTPPARPQTATPPGSPPATANPIAQAAQTGAMTLNLAGVAIVEAGSEKTTASLTDGPIEPKNFLLTQDGKMADLYSSFTFTSATFMDFFPVGGTVYVYADNVAYATGLHGTPAADHRCSLLTTDHDGLASCLDYDAAASEGTDQLVDYHLLKSDSKGAIYYLVTAGTDAKSTQLYRIRKYVPATKTYTDLTKPVSSIDKFFINTDDTLVYSLHDGTSAAIHYIDASGTDTVISDEILVSAAKAGDGKIVYESTTTALAAFDPASGKASTIATSMLTIGNGLSGLFTSKNAIFQMLGPGDGTFTIAQIYPTEAKLAFKTMASVMTAKPYGSTLLILGRDAAGHDVLSNYDLNTGTEALVMANNPTYPDIMDFDLTKDGHYAVMAAAGAASGAAPGYGIVVDLTATPPKVTAAAATETVIGVVAIK